MMRPLWTLPISDAVVRKLKDAGYEYLEDISSDECKSEVQQIAPELKNFSTTRPTRQTALECYKVEVSQNGNIVTFSKAVDDLLGGGIPTSKITELVGAPGSGKTQICLQLCISVQIPECLGCFSGSTIYIETNSNFSQKRIKEIYAASARHCSKIANTQHLSAEEKSGVHKFLTSDPHQNIIWYSIQTIEELKAMVYQIQIILQKSTNVRLIIIDSFTFPFYSTESSLERTKIISDILNHFNQLAIIHRIAIVITNDLTTCILDNENKEIIPSLGETFAHVVHNRLLLGQQKSSPYFTALLQKSSEFPTMSAYFQITNDGIRDVPANANE